MNADFKGMKVMVSRQYENTVTYYTKLHDNSEKLNINAESDLESQVLVDKEEKLAGYFHTFKILMIKGSDEDKGVVDRHLRHVVV